MHECCWGPGLCLRLSTCSFVSCYPPLQGASPAHRGLHAGRNVIVICGHTAKQHVSMCPCVYPACVPQNAYISMRLTCYHWRPSYGSCEALACLRGRCIEQGDVKLH